jgi:hypothetical protein
MHAKTLFIGTLDGLDQQGVEKIVVDNERDVWIQKVDANIKMWRQGDCVLGKYWFVYYFNPQRPLASDSRIISQSAPFSSEEQEIDLAESAVKGLVIVSQTCDIVRSCMERPFIEVAPLVEVDQQYLSEIQRGRRPRYAYIPGIVGDKLVADLDRVMTVEKAIVADGQRVIGCRTDQEVRALGQALARKRVRFAFPGDFNDFVKKLHNRLRDKHDKSSNEGEALRALHEIRVRAEPSWNESETSEIKLTFFFIRDERQLQFQGKGWDRFLAQWLSLMSDSERFRVNGVVISLEDMTAKEYIESDPLDLDHLSF